MQTILIKDRWLRFRSSSVYFILIASVAACSAQASGQTVPRCDAYASPTGGGSGKSESSPSRIAQVWSRADPGMTICLLDGVYRGADSMIDPPSGPNGTGQKPITVRA